MVATGVCGRVAVVERLQLGQFVGMTFDEAS
jgi:hypothetical protein